MNEKNLRDNFATIGKSINTILDNTCSIILELRKQTSTTAVPKDSGGAGGRISPRQVKLLRKIASEHNWNWNEFSSHIKQRFNRTVEYLSKKQASDLISELLEKKGENHGTNAH
jgi:hypothetical protein